MGEGGWREKRRGPDWGRQGGGYSVCPSPHPQLAAGEAETERERWTLGDELPEASGTRSLRPRPRSTDVSRCNPPLRTRLPSPPPSASGGGSLSSNRICPGSWSLSASVCLYASHRVSESLSHVSVSRCPLLRVSISCCKHFPPPRCPHPVCLLHPVSSSPHPQLSTSLTPCLFLCLFPGFAVYRSLTLRASVPLSLHSGNPLSLRIPPLSLGPRLEGRVGGALRRELCVPSAK